MAADVTCGAKKLPQGEEAATPPLLGMTPQCGVGLTRRGKCTLQPCLSWCCQRLSCSSWVRMNVGHRCYGEIEHQAGFETPPFAKEHVLPAGLPQRLGCSRSFHNSMKTLTKNITKDMGRGETTEDNTWLYPQLYTPHPRFRPLPSLRGSLQVDAPPARGHFRPLKQRTTPWPRKHTSGFSPARPSSLRTKQRCHLGVLATTRIIQPQGPSAFYCTQHHTNQTEKEKLLRIVSKEGPRRRLRDSRMRTSLSALLASKTSLGDELSRLLHDLDGQARSIAFRQTARARDSAGNGRR